MFTVVRSQNSCETVFPLVLYNAAFRVRLNKLRYRHHSLQMLRKISDFINNCMLHYIVDERKHRIQDKTRDERDLQFSFYAGGDSAARQEGQQGGGGLRPSDVREHWPAATGGMVWDATPARSVAHRGLQHPGDAFRHTADPGPIRRHIACRAEDHWISRRRNWPRPRIDSELGSNQRLRLPPFVHSSLHRCHWLRWGMLSFHYDENM